MNLPHNPFDPTPRSKDRKSKNAKRNFIDMVAYMDHCVGRIEDALIELGLRENTLMIFTADNGTNSSLTLDFFGTQRRGGKGYTHDHGTKVPLIVNLPGRIQAGQVNKDLICFSDLFPTIVEAANLPAKKITQGGWVELLAPMPGEGRQEAGVDLRLLLSRVRSRSNSTPCIPIGRSPGPATSATSSIATAASST